MMVQFGSITQTQDELTPIPERSIFGSIMLEAAKKINTLGYWWEVRTMIRDDDVLRPPTCIILPQAFRYPEQQLSGAARSVDCVMDIAFALKGKDDSIINDIALANSEAIVSLFSKNFDGDPGVFKFPAVPEHYNTTIEAGRIGAVQTLKDGVLAYSSGINVVFSVWYS
jgi:hypothetical protein